MLFDRKAYLDILSRKKRNGQVKVLTGPVGVGKTFLLFHLYKKHLFQEGVSPEQILEIPLEHPAFAPYRDPFRLNDYLKKQIRDEKSYYLFFDEIQLIQTVDNPYLGPGVKKISFVELLLGLLRKKNLDLYVTASYAPMLVSNIPTDFRGRTDHIPVYPLSFAEIKAALGPEDQVFRNYMHFGGMPQLYTMEKREDKENYLRKLWSENYLPNLFRHQQIRHSKETLDSLLGLVASSTGRQTNPSQLAHTFSQKTHTKLSPTTIARYLTYLEDSFLLSSVKRRDLKRKRPSIGQTSYYFSDPGLRNACLALDPDQDQPILETMVYNALRLRGFDVQTGLLHAFPVIQGKSKKVPRTIDFILDRGNFRAYVQTVFRRNQEEERIHKRNALRSIRDSFPKIVLVKDKIIPRYDQYGIYYMGIQDFLLQENLD